MQPIKTYDEWSETNNMLFDGEPVVKEICDYFKDHRFLKMNMVDKSSLNSDWAYERFKDCIKIRLLVPMIDQDGFGNTKNLHQLMIDKACGSINQYVSDFFNTEVGREFIVGSPRRLQTKEAAYTYNNDGLKYLTKDMLHYSEGYSYDAFSKYHKLPMSAKKRHLPKYYLLGYNISDNVRTLYRSMFSSSMYDFENKDRCFGFSDSSGIFSNKVIGINNIPVLFDVNGWKCNGMPFMLLMQYSNIPLFTITASNYKMDNFPNASSYKNLNIEFSVEVDISNSVEKIVMLHI